jgi:hypothetical protein
MNIKKEVSLPHPVLSNEGSNMPSVGKSKQTKSFYGKIRTYERQPVREKVDIH